MENRVKPLASSPDAGFGQSAPKTPIPANGGLQSKIAAGALDQADLRLVIEESAGSYIYKTVNRRTGEILAQYPREELVKMHEAEAYAAGQVIKTKA
jgi:flagellar protein FlaG